MNWLQQLRMNFQRMMYGRYGADQLYRTTLIVSVVLVLLGMLPHMWLLQWVALVLLAWCYFRMFSRNIEKRYQENMKYLAWEQRVKGWWQDRKYRLEAGKDYRFFNCPQCGAHVRVPKGRGKIIITCPKCRKEFIKKT
jgi:predicted RNA-binding Zn-ribbon protein involved in translation (DUF1610 family)